MNKDLFERIMGIRVIEFKETDNGFGFFNALNVGIRCIERKHDLEFISRNDLFFKAKEWAVLNGYELESKTNTEGEGVCSILKGGFCIIKCLSKTETSSVFDACVRIVKYIELGEI